MDYNYKNLVIDNIFTEEQIEDIYKHIESAKDDQKYLQEIFSHTAYLNWLPQHIVDRVVEVAQSTTDIELELRELSFARYEKLIEGNPVQLLPHRDETFREPRLTLDIQLRASRSWPLVVEGKTFVLEDNQALTFAGTHQVHWREKIEFNDDDYVDMVFCHFSEKGVEKEILGPYPEPGDELGKHDQKMREKAHYWQKIYNES